MLTSDQLIVIGRMLALEIDRQEYDKHQRVHVPVEFDQRLAEFYGIRASVSQTLADTLEFEQAIKDGLI